MFLETLYSFFTLLSAFLIRVNSLFCQGWWELFVHNHDSIDDAEWQLGPPNVAFQSKLLILSMNSKKVLYILQMTNR